MTGAFVVILSAMGFGRSGYPAVLPYMKQGLSLTNTQMGLLATGNLSGYLLSSVAVGFLAIRYKPRNLIILCQLVVAATLALTGLSSSFAFALVMQTVWSVQPAQGAL